MAIAHTQAESDPKTGLETGSGDAGPVSSLPRPPVTRRELLAIALIVALADRTVFHGQGYAGLAVLFLLTPLLLAFGTYRVSIDRGTLISGALLVVLSAKLLWCGSALLCVCGIGLTAAFAMTLSGWRPFVPEVVLHTSQAMATGFRGFWDYGCAFMQIRPASKRHPWINLALPVLALLVFGTLFVLANPDLVTAFSEGARWLQQNVFDLLGRYAPTPLQILFWIFVAWLASGLLRPTVDLGATCQSDRFRGEVRKTPGPAPLYVAYRNTMLTVIVLFAIYLVFEFLTLWFRKFPEGFYYSGYAHEGAAWLTVALALATVVLSMVFRGQVLQDARLPQLRRLAWIWSLENMLLAIAVYNRLFIYIGFNGMSRMRIVGLLGMTTVVVGFALVLWKIAHNYSFLWLVRRHLWALALAIFVYAVIPVDTLVVSYNVRRILAGDPAPSVQISVHPISSEGVLPLRPLLKCEDQMIREGVRALLSTRLQNLERRENELRSEGWTAFQISDQMVVAGLRPISELKMSPTERTRARRDFDDYAYQWY